MALSEEKQKAYADLEQSIDNLIKVYEDDGLLSEFVVLTATTRFEPDNEDIADEDDGVRREIRFFTRPGQSEFTTIGMVERFRALFVHGWGPG